MKRGLEESGQVSQASSMGRGKEESKSPPEAGTTDLRRFAEEEEAVPSLDLARSFNVRAKSEYPTARPLLADGGAGVRQRDERRGQVVVYLVRHGESEANVDPSIMKRLPDHIIPLSLAGRQQAAEAGTALAAALRDRPDPPRILVSPYKRARDTADIMLARVPSGTCLDLHEHVFLGEQQFGLFEGLSLQEIREQYPSENAHFEKSIHFGGRFYARMPLGESRFDVVARVLRVIDDMLREEHVSTFVLVAHGMTLRAFAMAWLGRTPEWLEQQRNPCNCSIRVLDGFQDRGYLFPGFEGRTATDKDKGTDLVEQVSSQPESATMPKRALEARLEALFAEAMDIRRELARLKDE